MRNEQENNYRNRRNPRHEQNAKDRWGKPDPRMGPNYRPEDRRQGYRDPQDDWRAFEDRENRHFQQDNRYRNNYRNERPDWQQQDWDYSRYSQHAHDRWREERDQPPQHHHPRHASERFYQEQRRRNW
ncbi:hypothetical protein [Pontibacter burrus]|uniref:Uncharacterized protein n=1 Tax=Pontibacter burrus TaxID=2704466 RepID=A0A6B3LI20_9BACT|nr:hypothetical protein [Pontibacter burrus]NEM96642.1 hypothetical protein [Pontibacter burrus]